MKAKCIREIIDIEKVNYYINIFRSKNNGDNPSYLVMNFETGASIRSGVYSYIDVVAEESGGEKLLGIPVAYNDALDYGEIDIV